MKKTNLLVGLFCIAGLSSCQKEKSKPNIIYILMDDHGLWRPANVTASKK